MTIVPPGAALAALRKPRTVTCAWCGAIFQAIDSKARFCSNRCRQADKYRRQKKPDPEQITTTEPPT